MSEIHATRRERFTGWLRDRSLIPSFVFGWWLNRRCPHCGETRYNHPHAVFGGWRG